MEQVRAPEPELVRAVLEREQVQDRVPVTARVPAQAWALALALRQETRREPSAAREAELQGSVRAMASDLLEGLAMAQEAASDSELAREAVAQEVVKG